MTSLRVTDDLGRELVFVHPPARVVSLVPSDTYNVIALGARDRLVGRTTYCEAEGVATVGGTKDVDVDAVLALAPNLVIANQEENTRKALEALAVHVPVLVSLPRRVGDGVAHLARLARVLGVGATDPAKSLLRRGAQLRPRVHVDRASPAPDGAIASPSAQRRAFVPIWMDPLMTINADTYGSDVLAYAGVANAFGDRLRLYPLAADLGKQAASNPGGRDTRYPRVTLDEARARGADLVILPDEPYLFSEADEAVFREALPHARVVRVSGKDLFWYGAWTIETFDRLAAQLAG